MKSHDRVDAKEAQAHLRGRPDDPPVRYRVLGRYGDVLNAARGYEYRPPLPPVPGSPAAAVDVWSARRTR